MRTSLWWMALVVPGFMHLTLAIAQPETQGDGPRTTAAAEPHDVPPAAEIVADASTGDITFTDATLVNTTLRARDGAKFRFLGSLTLTNCTIDGDLSAENCGTLYVNRDLTLLNGATISLSGNPNTCFGDGVFCSLLGTAGNHAIRGQGRIVLQRRNFDRVFKVDRGTMTIEPGIEIDVPPVASASPTTLLVNTGAKLINQGRIRLRRGGPVTIDGDLRNEGVIEIETGSTTVLGPFVNTGILKTDAAALTLSGAWSNAGLFDLRNTTWSLTTIPADGWGTLSGTGNTLALSGSINAPLLKATSGTGNITLNNVSATATRFEAATGLSFRFSGTTNLTRCTLAADATLGACGVVTIRERFTLANNAVLRVRNTCNSTAISTVGAVILDGTGSILLDTAGSNGAFFAVGASSTATVEAGVTIGLDPASAALDLGMISLSGSLISKGTLSADRPGRTLAVTSGSLTVQGLARALGGTLTISSGLTNFVGTNRTLTGGRWVCDAGTITLGNGPVHVLDQGTDVTLRGPSSFFGPLWSLHRIDGTLRLDNTYLGSNPASGTMQIAGTLELAPNATLAIGGPINVLPTARVGIDVANPTNSGRITSTGAVTLAGSLTGSFVPPYVPTEGDRVESVVAAPSITGAFSSPCFAANAAALGVTPQLRPGPPDNLDLVATTASGASPTILAQPLDMQALPDAEFAVVAGPDSSTYRWHRNGVPLNDGLTAAGSMLQGAATPHLRILLAAPGDAGLYRCIVVNDCGSTASTPALLTVCPGDLNADALVNDSDFVTFAAAYNILDCADATMPTRCPSDLNRDGVVNDDDFSIFAVAYDAALCP